MSENVLNVCSYVVKWYEKHQYDILGIMTSLFSKYNVCMHVCDCFKFSKNEANQLLAMAI